MNWVDHLLGILLGFAMFVIAWCAFDSIWRGKP